MNKIRQLLRILLKAMCSHYNGIQVFLFPGTIFYLLSSTSLVWSFTSLVSLRIHFLPLVFFMILMLYVGFMVLKIYSCLFEGPHTNYPHRMDDFYNHVIKLHLILFITVMVLMVFYVLSRFLGYFYGIQLPLNKGVWFTFRAFTILIIAVHYVRQSWMAPLRKRNMSEDRSDKYLAAWILKHPVGAIKYSGLLLVVMIVAIRLYQLVIYTVISPAQLYFSSVTGLKLNIELIPVQGIASVFYNVFMLFAAFMLSNILFYPLILSGQMLSNAFHPIQFKQVTYGKS